MIMNTVFDIPENKEVCIVAEEGREKFAESLMTLISAESDIKAGACSYKKYKDNLLTSTANYIIFLGNFPEKKNFMEQQNRQDESAEYGIYIGKHGRHALIQADFSFLKILKKNNKYEKYINKTKKSLQKAISLQDVVINLALAPLIGVLAPVGWGVWYWEKRKTIINQLYACAISEFYEKYLKSFLGVNNNE